MNRHERRKVKAVVRGIQKVSDKLMTKPEGPWVKMTTEEFNATLDNGLALQGAHRGYEASRGALLKQVDRAWYNNHFSVMARPVPCAWGLVDHLWVKRNDGKPIREWADMQRIKNELMGSERTAVEVYPPADEVLDQSNWYHLWVLPVGMDLPFSLTRRS